MKKNCYRNFVSYSIGNFQYFSKRKIYEKSKGL